MMFEDNRGMDRDSSSDNGSLEGSMPSAEPQRRSEVMARDARLLLTQENEGILSTHSKKKAGFPIGSLVTYDIDDSGRVVIFISQLSQHYRDLADNPKASMTVRDSQGVGNAQPFARASVLMEFSQVPDEEAAAVKSAFVARNPGAAIYQSFGDFKVFRGEVDSVHWVGGFGNAGWVTRERYDAQQHDPVAYASRGVIEHMNTDHADALRKYVDTYTGHSSEQFSDIRLIRVSSEGIKLALTGARGTTFAEIPFAERVDSPEEVRSAMIALSQNL